MFTTRKEVDEHVHKLLGKVPPGPERDIKCLAVARLYIKIQEYSKAAEYLTCYLKVKDEVVAHRLIAQCFKQLKQPDNIRALHHLQRCMQLNPRQRDVIREACQLLLDDSNLYTAERANYWLGLATEDGDELQESELIFSLRLKLNQQGRDKNGGGGDGDADKDDETLEILMHKELQARPQDVSVRVRLLLSYVETKKIEKAFYYAYNVELQLDEKLLSTNGDGTVTSVGSPFSQSIEWYKSIWLVLTKYEQSKDFKKSWSYWHLTLMTLDRLMSLSLDSNNALTDGTSQLFRFDQYLHKFSSELEKIQAENQNDIQNDFLKSAQGHFSGQLMLHAVSLLFKREITGNKNKWIGTLRDALPLLLLGYQINPFPNTQPNWLKHCDKSQRKLFHIWRAQTAFRCAQMGRTLLGCLRQNESQDDDEYKEGINNHINSLRQSENQGLPSLWLNSDDLLAEARQICADKQWRRQVYQILFTHGDQKLKEQTSHLVKNARLQQPLYDWPRVSDLESYEQEALLSSPQSLSQHVYLALSTKPENLGDHQRVRFYGNLRKDIKSNQNLSYCSPDSLTQIDIDIFLYAVVLQTQRKLSVQRDNYDSSNVGNRSACARPHMLPYNNILKQLTTPEQSTWWQLAQSWNGHHQFTDGNRIEQRAQLQVGLEAVRATNGPRMDLIILFQLGHILNSRQDRLSLQTRINLIFKQGFQMMRRQSQQDLEPFARYFKYSSPSSTASLKLMHSLVEKAVTYLSKKAFKENQFEEFIEEIRGLHLPIASYLQAEAYRMLEECNRTTKSSRARYLEQRQNCLQQTQQLLQSHPEHALAPIIGRDIKRCQQEARHLHQQLSPDLHNNSSTYEDAEDADTEPDYYGGLTNSKVNESHSRSRVRDADVPSLDVDRMFKKITTEFCQFKEDVNDNIGAMRKDVKTLTATLEDMLKRLKLSTSSHNQEVDPAAALGLDDLFIMEDLAVAPQPQQHGTQPPQQNSQQQQQSQIQAQHHHSQQQQPQMFPPNTHPGPGTFGAGPPSGFYNNGLPPMTAANPAQAAAYSNQWMFDYYNLCNLYGPRNSNFNLPPNAMYGSGPPAGGAPYLDALGHYGQSPLAPPPPGPSVPGSGALDPTTPVGGIGSLPNPTTTSFFNTPPTPLTTFGAPQLSGMQTQSLTQPPQQPAAPHSQPQKSSMNVPAAMFNRALNNQPVEKEPPANVVITNSDPLPKADALTSAAGQLQLSVTIPAQHIKPSLAPVPATAPLNPLLGTGVTVPPAVPPSGAFNFSVGTQGSNIFGSGGGGGAGGEMTFSFKPQVAQAAAEKQKEKEKEQQQQKEEKPAAVEIDTSFDGSAELDYDPRPDLQGIIPLPDEVEVRTGEEDEEIKFSFKAKLFRHVDKEWKERGVGLIKILKNNSNGIYRVLMRRDQTHKICANHKITKDMELTQPTQDSEKKSFIWAANDFADETLHLEKFLVRFKLPETALQFQEAFKEAQNDIKKLKDNQDKQQSKVIKQDNFVTSTPANPVLSKPLELVKAQTTAVETSTGPTGVNFVAKSLFGATAPPTSTTTTTPSPFANFSFSNMSNSKVNSSPFGNLSFGSVSALSTAHSTSTNNTTLFTTALIKDSTVLNANPTATPVGATTSAAEAEVDILDEYVPTAQFTPVIPLPELVEVVTGEENESILFEHRAKLLRYDRESNEWKERGLGNIKLLQSKLNPQQIRLVMRREQIHKLCCNQRLLAETKFNYLKNSQTALTWAAKDYSEGEMTSELLCIRFKTADTCKAFLDEIIKAQELLTLEKSKVSEQKADEKRHQMNKEEADKKPVVGFGDAFKPVSGSWSCESCYTNNGAGQLYCLACEAPKDNSVPPKPVNAGVLDSGSALNLSISTAGKFNFGFGTAVTTAVTTPAASFGFGGSNKTKEKSPLPFVANAAPVAVTTSAPSALGFGPTKNVSSGFGDSFKPKAGSWTCSGCYVTNEAGIVSCKACETPKDGAEDKKDSKLGISSNINWPAATQFKFGFNSATPAIETPFGSANFSFTPKASGIISTSNTSSVPTSTGGTVLGSNKFSFSMPKPVATEPKSPQADESANDNDYHVEEENNAYFAPVIPLPDKIEVRTGEEDEELLYEHRAKLYRLSQEGEWKERGLGNVKILQHKQTHKLRVVMRREQVLKICLNHILDQNVLYKPKDEKSWMFAVNDYSEGENILERFALRFKTPEIAQGFYQAVMKALNISPEDGAEQNVLAPVSAASKEIQNLAGKLKLNEEFLLSNKKCIGCRGCDVDSFEFGTTSVDENGEDSTEPALPLYLPALKLPHKVEPATSIPTTNTIQSLATNRTSIFKASPLSAAASGGFGSFGGFGQAISANSTISATTNQAVESKPLAASSNSYVFGSGKTENPLGIVFSASNNQSLQQSVESGVPKSIFGQTLSKPDDGEKAKSIFGGTSSNLFDGSGSGSGTAGGSAGFVFGSSTAISNITFADIGKEKNQTEKEKPLSNDNSKLDPKIPVFGTFNFGSSLTNKEISGSTPKVFPDLGAKAGDDFASLVAKGQNTNAFQKSTTGGFYNLTHQNDFKNFEAAKVTDGDTEKIAASVENEDADTTNDDIYDPYYAPIVELPDEIVVTTGEENETKLFGERTKLYRYHPDTKQWKERGVGEIKVLEHPELKTFRMVMRQEQIHKLILNMKISSAFKIEFMNDQGKSFLWANYNYAVDSEGKMGTEGVLERLACRFKKQEPADEFYNIVNSCINRAKTLELEAGTILENDEEAEDSLNDSAAEAEDEETETEDSPRTVTEQSE